jgi:hypothetical protein
MLILTHIDSEAISWSRLLLAMKIAQSQAIHGLACHRHCVSKGIFLLRQKRPGILEGDWHIFLIDIQVTEI